MEALTASYLLMKTRGPRSCQQGEEAYGHALNAVVRALNRPFHKVESDVLMSIMCLCLYENIIVTKPRSWIKHYKGISQIVSGSCYFCYYFCYLFLPTFTYLSTD
jgi:hypothetical protein